MGLILAPDGTPAVSAPLRVRDTRVLSRTPDPSWVAALRALSAHSETHSWLHLAWEPGDAWEPVERWVLWDVLPVTSITLDGDTRCSIDPARLAALQGPAPRSTGHYCGPTSLCGCDPNQRPDCWKGGATRLVDQRQWELYRTTGGLATRFWVIQGDAGGHLFRYTDSQAQLAEWAGLSPEPPVPGELAYAEPDRRTWDAVAQYDAIQQRGGLLAKSVRDLDARDRDAALDVRRALLGLMGNAVRQAIDAGGRAWQQDLATHRLASWRQEPDPDYDLMEDDFFNDET